jgi:hypothetical protein
MAKRTVEMWKTWVTGNDADRIAAQILRADEMFLAEIGRLTQLFSEIENWLVRDTLELSRLTSDKEMSGEAVSHLTRLRILEKRDVLKRAWRDIGRFYDADPTRVDKALDELGNVNRLRRAVVHGWIRWSVPDEEPVFVESHGGSLPVRDLADVNSKVLNWMHGYSSSQAAVLRAVLHSYDAFADRLLGHRSVPANAQALLRELKAKTGQFGS